MSKGKRAQKASNIPGNADHAVSFSTVVCHVGTGQPLEVAAVEAAAIEAAVEASVVAFIVAAVCPVFTGRQVGSVAAVGAGTAVGTAVCQVAAVPLHDPVAAMQEARSCNSTHMQRDYQANKQGLEAKRQHASAFASKHNTEVGEPEVRLASFLWIFGNEDGERYAAAGCVTRDKEHRSGGQSHVGHGCSSVWVQSAS